MKPFKALLVILLVSACSQTVVNYPSVCNSDETCKRNQNAQTLIQLGHDEAATVLICEDPLVSDVLRDKCNSSSNR